MTVADPPPTTETPPTVTIERLDGVALVRIARPPVNALDEPTMLALAGAVTGAAVDADAIVVAGTGRALSAGLDTGDFGSTGPDGPDVRAGLIRGVNAMAAAPVLADAPVVAAIGGHALGGGLVLALACDARIAVRGTGRWGLMELQAGVAYPVNAAAVVIGKLAGTLRDRMMVRGDLLDADAALAAGLADEVHDTLEAAEARAVELAAWLAAQPGFRAIKAQANDALRRRMIDSSEPDPIAAAWEDAVALAAT